MTNRVYNILSDLGIGKERISEIQDYVLNSPAGSIDGEGIENRLDNSVTLDILIALTFDLSRFKRESFILLGKLFKIENELCNYDRGRLYHVRAYFDWKVNNYIYSSCNGLNRSIGILSNISSEESSLYLARIHDTYGQILKSQGLLNDARDEYEISLSLKENSDDFYGKSITLGNLGRLNAELGNFRKAIEYLQQDLDIVMNYFDNKGIEAQLLNTIADCLIELGNYQAAENQLKESARLNKEVSNNIGLCFNYLTYVKLYLNQDKIPESLEYLNRIEDLLNSETISVYLHQQIEAEKLKLKAEILYHTDKLEESELMYQTAIDSYCGSMSFSPVEKAKLLHGYADLLMKKNDHTKAHQFYRGSLQQLDITEANELRKKIEDKLIKYNKDSWILHTAGRFIGHHQIDLLLNETGKEGFRGDNQFAAVLFCDIIDFTSISEKFNPGDLITFLNDFFRLMTRSIEHFDGFVDKFIGDAIMAVFAAKENTPEERSRVVNNACLAALMMTSELNRFNRKCESGIPEIRISTGIHAGDSIAGLIGSPQKRSYTFMGDTVNTASRLEGLAKLLGADIVISEQVYSLLQNEHLFLLRPLGKFLPKGKEQALVVVELMGIDDETSFSNVAKKEIKEAKKHILNFQKREFSKAALGFERLYRKGEKSHRSKGYEFLLAKSKSMMIDPPPENWDGEVRLFSK